MASADRIVARLERMDSSVQGLRRKDRLILAVSLLADVVLLLVFRDTSQLTSFRAMIASLLAVAGTGVGLAAGPRLGLTVALFSGTLYYSFVAEREPLVSLAGALGAIALWSVVAVLSGVVADAYRTRIAARQQELLRRERFQRALNRFGEQIMMSLDSEALLTGIVEAAGREFGAAWSVIAVPEDDDWVAQWAWRLPPEELGIPRPAGEWPAVTRAARDLRPAFLTRSDAEEEMARAWHGRQGLQAAAAIPLVISGKLVGCIVLGFAERSGFNDAEVDFARSLGARFSQALANARLYESERDIALTLQRSFMPRLPQVPGLLFGFVSQPAQTPELIGGDFVDVFQLGDDRVLVMLGDVEGKGVRAATIASMVRSGARALAVAEPSPAVILTHINELLIKQRAGQFVTALLLVIDTATGEIEYASAGHPPPLLLSSEAPALLRAAANLPLGSFPLEFESATASLRPGETLFLYTDGLVEARRDGELFGQRRLLETIADDPGASPQLMVEEAAAAAQAFAGRLQDDVQVLALKFAPERPARELTQQAARHEAA